MCPCADVASAVDLSLFAVLVLQKSSTSMGSNELTFQGRDGLILLFNSTDPVPLAAWSVRKVRKSFSLCWSCVS